VVFEALKNRDFAAFWVAAAISNTGNWMQALTVPYIVYRLTGSTSWLGVAGAVAFLSSVIGTLCIGALVDRYDRRRLLLLLQVLQMTMATATWLMWASGRSTAENMIALSSASGFLGGMTNPAWNSFVPMLVPRELMASAIRLNAMQFAFGRALGPVITGAVLGPFGPGATLFINVASFVVVIGVLVVLRPRTTPPVRGASPVRQALEGWRYVLARRSLVVVPLCMLVSGFFGSSIIQLMSSVAEEQFDRDRSAIGVLVGAFGIGSVIGSFAVTAFGDRVRRSSMLYAAFAGWIVGLVVMGLGGDSYAMGLVGLTVMGIAHVTTATTVSTALQLQVDDAYRGRAAVAHMQGILLGVGFGALVLAQIAEATSLTTMELVSAGALGVFLLIATPLFSGFRIIDTDAVSPEPEPGDAPAARLR
jgi:MFS family permease